MHIPCYNQVAVEGYGATTSKVAVNNDGFPGHVIASQIGEGGISAYLNDIITVTNGTFQLGNGNGVALCICKNATIYRGITARNGTIDCGCATHHQPGAGCGRNGEAFRPAGLAGIVAGRGRIRIVHIVHGHGRGNVEAQAAARHSGGGRIAVAVRDHKVEQILVFGKLERLRLGDLPLGCAVSSVHIVQGGGKIGGAVYCAGKGLAVIRSGEGHCFAVGQGDAGNALVKNDGGYAVRTDARDVPGNSRNGFRRAFLLHAAKGNALDGEVTVVFVNIILPIGCAVINGGHHYLVKAAVNIGNFHLRNGAVGGCRN